MVLKMENNLVICLSFLLVAVGMAGCSSNRPQQGKFDLHQRIVSQDQGSTQYASGHGNKQQQSFKSYVIMPPNNDQMVSSYAASHSRLSSEPISSSSSSGGGGGGFMTGNLELALRQAAGDESVFQPSPTIGAVGHNFDWFSNSDGLHSTVLPTAKQADQQTIATIDSDIHSSDASLSASSSAPPTSATDEPPTIGRQSIANTPLSTSPTTAQPITTSQSMITSTTTTTTTTEQNNNILNQEDPNLDRYHRLNNHQYLGNHQKEYQTNNMSPQQATLDINNQVVYEAQTQGVTSANYYFSSAERLPDRTTERPSNVWWAIGIGNEYERVNNLTRDDYLGYCEKSPLLVSNKQRSLCRLHPKVMHVVARGLRLAIDECQSRFASSRWNCSVILESATMMAEASPEGDHQQGSMTNVSMPRNTVQVFGDVMQHPNRERSFLNAIIAASLAHAMTKACSNGELPEECSCDKKIRSKTNKGRVEWVACSDDIDYGARFSRDFTDNYESEPDAIATIYMHNNEVGRRVFKSATDITCTCLNGENGLCQTKRCWKHLGSFTDVGDELMKRYEGATHVQRSSKDPHKLRPVRRGVRRPKRKDLVYIDESPDYCHSDTRLGILGTQNRRCNSTSSGAESCSLLCCGRGYQEIVDEVEEDCNCKFVWCCQVKCDKCKRRITNDVCN